MKQIILAIAVLMSFTVFSQNNPNNNRKPAEERATRATRMMTANLQLSHEQQSQIMPILMERERNKDAARNQHANNREAERNAVKKVNSDADERLKEVLTAEQFQKLQTLREEQKQKAKERKTGDAKEKRAAPSDEEDFY